jgi:hypothetical protein
MVDRSALETATVSSAFTVAAKPGSAITDAPRSKNNARVEMDLIM